MAKNHLSIYYQNCRGIRTKLNTLYMNVLANAYDVIVFTETWLTPDISDNEFIDQRYLVFRCDRDRIVTQKKDGGGVLIAVSRELKPSCLALSPPLSLPEHKIIKIPSCRDNYSLICATYIPPNTTEEIYIHFLNSLSALFDDPRVDNVILTGDFNMPQLNWDRKTSFMECSTNNTSNVTRQLINICSQLNFKQYNHLTNCNGRILDLFFSNVHSVTYISDDPLLPIDIYHPAFYVHVPFIRTTSISKCKTPNPLNYYKADYCEINKDISNVDWSGLLEGLVPEEAVAAFYEKMFEIIRSHAPTCRQRNFNYPIWFTRSLIRIFKNKTCAWIKWKKRGNISDYEKFSLIRARFKREVDRCYKRYMTLVEDNVATNIKAFWSYIANRKTSHRIPSTIHYKQDSACDPTSVCNLFSSFFHSVYEPSTFNSDSWIPPPATADHDVNLSKLYFPLENIRRELKMLDPTKGPGPDGIPAVFLKNTHSTVCYPIFILFNKCISCGVFPDVWKRANIVPIHKSGSKNNVEMYRPISILSALSKLFERLVHSEIYPVIRHVIIKEQHGFVKDRSCVSNLLIFTTKLFESIDTRQQTDAVYTDFQKAFDKVDHRLLLNKIAYNGIRGDLLRWFVSYITNRTQKVVISGFESSCIHVTSGVPQGSILGPLLFILFINDIKYCFQNSKFLLYADDLKVFKQISNEQDCVEFQRDLDRFSDYCSFNKLYLSLPKCLSITFTKKINIIQYNYRLAYSVINKVSNLRDLGVQLDSKLHLDIHVENIVNKAYQMFGFVMRASRDFHRPSTFLHLYKSIIRPQLEYAVPIWNPYYTKYIEIIELVQRKFLRAMQFRCFRKQTSYQSLLKEYDLLTLQSRRVLLDTMTLFGVCRNKFDCPDLVTGLCYLIPRTVNVREVRSRRLFATSFCRSNAGVRSPLYRLVDTYNTHFGAIDILFLNRYNFKHCIIKILKDQQLAP